MSTRCAIRTQLSTAAGFPSLIPWCPPGSAGSGRSPTGHSIQHLVAAALLPAARDEHYLTVRRPGRRCRAPCAIDNHNGHAGRRWDGSVAAPCSSGTARTRLPTRVATPVDLSGPRAGHWTRTPRRRLHRVTPPPGECNGLIVRNGLPGGVEGVTSFQTGGTDCRFSRQHDAVATPLFGPWRIVGFYLSMPQDPGPDAGTVGTAASRPV